MSEAGASTLQPSRPCRERLGPVHDGDDVERRFPEWRHALVPIDGFCGPALNAASAFISSPPNRQANP